MSAGHDGGASRSGFLDEPRPAATSRCSSRCISGDVRISTHCSFYSDRVVVGMLRQRFDFGGDMQNWSVVRYDLDVVARDWPTELTGPIPHLGDLLNRWRTVDRRRFLMRGDGFVDVRVNAFLSSARMRTLAGTTNRDYAQSLCLWLNFLHAKGRVWSEATEDDVEDFEFWRRTDPNDSAPVGASAFSKDIAACKKFYSWAAERFSDVVDVYFGIDPPPFKAVGQSSLARSRSSRSMARRWPARPRILRRNLAGRKWIPLLHTGGNHAPARRLRRGPHRPARSGRRSQSHLG
jgi:hypothetical protein